MCQPQEYIYNSNLWIVEVELKYKSQELGDKLAIEVVLFIYLFFLNQEKNFKSY